jgi:hypothetical protein
VTATAPWPPISEHALVVVHESNLLPDTETVDRIQALTDHALGKLLVVSAAAVNTPTTDRRQPPTQT